MSLLSLFSLCLFWCCQLSFFNYLSVFCIITFPCLGHFYQVIPFSVNWKLCAWSMNFGVFMVCILCKLGLPIRHALRPYLDYVAYLYQSMDPLPEQERFEVSVVERWYYLFLDLFFFVGTWANYNCRLVTGTSFNLHCRWFLSFSPLVVVVVVVVAIGFLFF